jgi:hypothetical protein
MWISPLGDLGHKAIAASISTLCIAGKIAPRWLRRCRTRTEVTDGANSSAGRSEARFKCL